MIAYIAGKITGDPNYRKKFQKAEDRLIFDEAITSVLNPATLPEGLSTEDYMSICISMLIRSNVVFLLPDAETSKGAMIEKAIAEYVGIPVYQLSADDLV